MSFGAKKWPNTVAARPVVASVLFRFTFDSVAAMATDYFLQKYQWVANDWWDQWADPRTLPYVPGGPGWLLSVIVAYWAFVLFIGPLFMKNRQPFELR